ncbi:MAG: glycosyltransferase, partial [Rhodospirillaceae bacterium]
EAPALSLRVLVAEDNHVNQLLTAALLTKLGHKVEVVADGREAVFYQGPDDLLAKARHYLANDAERQAVAAAGRRRCEVSGYSHDARLTFMLDAAMKQRS